jgi:hypothetical protein
LHKFKNCGVEWLNGFGIFITWLKDINNLTNIFLQFGLKCGHSWGQTKYVATLP